MCKNKIVKKYTFEIKNEEGSCTTIFGKIEKEGCFYFWNVSHCFRPNPIAGYYYPGKTASSISEAEMCIESYVNAFTTDFISNPHY